jgi:hypothetical protein
MAQRLWLMVEAWLPTATPRVSGEVQHGIPCFARGDDPGDGGIHKGFIHFGSIPVSLDDMCKESILAGERCGISPIGGFHHDDAPIEHPFSIGRFYEMGRESAQKDSCAEHDHFFGQLQGFRGRKGDIFIFS